MSNANSSVLNKVALSSIPLGYSKTLVSLYSMGPSGPFDLSYPLLAYAAGKATAEEREAIMELLGRDERERQRIAAAWQNELAKDPDLINDEKKLLATAIKIDPDFIPKAEKLYHAILYSKQAKKEEQTLPYTIDKVKAEAERLSKTLPELDIARAEEARARTGLISQQTITEQEKRPELLSELRARTAAERELAGLRGAQALTEEQKRPWTIEELKQRAEMERQHGMLYGAQIPKTQAQTEEIKKRTSLMEKENRYRIPSSMYNLLTSTMVSHYWPIAQQYLPEELKIKGMAIFTDPMTGRPDEAKMRAYLPPEFQREYDEVKLKAEDLISNGLTPSEAFRRAYEVVTGEIIERRAGRPPVVFK